MFDWNFGIKKRLFCFLVVSVLLLFIINLIELHMFIDLKNKLYNHTESDSGTAKCRIPRLIINDKEIMSVLRPVRKCTCGLSPLVISNLTSLAINESALKDYGIGKIKEVNCSYTPFWRVNPKGNEDDNRIQYGIKHYFLSSAVVKEEFVRVECQYDKKVYKDFFSFVPTKKIKVNSKRTMDESKPNIIIMGTDSLSRLQLYRTMPKVVEYLREELKAIEFMHYNKIADNTFPNLIAALTGQSYEEFQHQCWPSAKDRFDNCSFIWQNYSRSDYITSFAEEMSTLGLFTLEKKGWLKQPTDYYWNTFDYHALQSLNHSCIPLYPRCMGVRPMYKVLLDYVEKFTEAMKNNYFFTFMWITTLAHDNYDTATLGEKDYIEHFKFLKDSGTLDKSVFIFLSDHGHRFGDIVNTHQGHLEERLPFIFFVLPTWFRKQYPAAVSNMKRNAYRLTTHYDLHATLNHILHPEDLVEKKLSAVAANERSVSLFRLISTERTCQSAGIEMHWCTCLENSPVDINDQIVRNVANYAVGHLNNLLTKYQDCEKLNLTTVTKARVAVYEDVNNITYKFTSYYTVTFKTMPGDGWFDTTVRCFSCKNKDFKISGIISRLNIYGDTSYCIDDLNLKLYCYCKHQLRHG